MLAVRSRRRRYPHKRTSHLRQSSRLHLERLEPRLALAAWIPQGPAPTINSQVENIEPDNQVSGAIHTVAAHPTDPNELYVGAVNGGVWKTNNAQAASPTWMSLTDDMPSLSIGALVFDPTDSSSQTIVAGVGHFSSFGRRGGPLSGLLRTTNGGDTWAVLGEQELQGRSVSGLAARGDLLLVSTNRFGGGVGGGVYRSIDGGASFQFASGTNGLALGAAFDLVGDPTNVNRYYVSVGEVGLFRSDDAGLTWLNVSANDQSTGGFHETITTLGNNNTEIAVAGDGRVYVAAAVDGQARYIGYSTNFGVSWTAMDLPQTPESDGDTEGLNPRVKPGGQGAIHSSILVDPNDPNIVYVGGDRQDGPYPNFVGATTSSGRLFRGDARVAPTGGVPSPQWEHLTHRSDIAAIPGGGTANASAPHADSREMVFDAAGDLIEVDDGGIYARSSPRDNTGVWLSLNGNLAITEIHDLAYDSNSDVIVAGTQDTGTVHQPVPGATIWDTVSGGDGGDIAIDDQSNPGFSTRYTSAQELRSFRRRVYDANNVLVSTASPALTVVGGGNPLVPQFVTPVALNAVAPTRLIIGGENSVYESLDQGETLTEIGPGIGVNRVAVAYGGRSAGQSNPDVLYVGSGDQIYVRTGPGPGMQATTGQFPGSVVRDVVLDPDDWMTAYAIDANRVFRTADGGDSWTDLTGNLVNASLRAIDFLSGAVDRLVVGGIGGVFAMSLDRLGIWGELGDALPNVPIFDLEYDETDGVLVAGTLGRGAFLLNSPLTESIDVVPQVVVKPSSTTLTTGEDGRGAMFDVFLSTAPTESVTLPITSSDPLEAAVNVSQLVFTSGNWSQPQTVVISGVDDAAVDGDVELSIALGPAASSTAGDPNYHGFDPADLVVTNIDDDQDDLLYWVDGSTDLLERATRGGSNVQTLVDMQARLNEAGDELAPGYLAVHAADRKIYWTDSEQGRIFRSDLSGGTIDTVVSELADVRGIAIDAAATKMYWVEAGSDRIRRSNLDGSQIETIVTGGVTEGQELEIDPLANKLYWTDRESDTIRRVNLDGSGAEVLIRDAGAEPSGFELDLVAGKMYWSEVRDDRIVRADLDGGNVEVVLDLGNLVGTSEAKSVAVDTDNSKLYWSDLATGTVYRANFDGTAVAELARVEAPLGITVATLFPGVSAFAPTGVITEESGAAATIEVTLDAPPLSTVAIPLSVSDETEATISPETLSFNAADWDVPQTITITGVDDSERDGDVGYAIELGTPISADSRYSSLAPIIFQATNYDDEYDIGSNLAHHWKFDETSGNEARDSVGGNHARLVNWDVSESKWVPGRIGGALDFADVDNYVATGTAIEQDRYSITFWLNTQQRVGINPRIAGPPDGPGIVINNETSEGVGLYSKASNLHDPVPPQLRNWEHFAVTLDHTTGLGQVYRNGKQVVAGSFSPEVPQLAWVFGHNADVDNHNDSLDGFLDDLRVYDRVLSAADVRALGRDQLFLSINDVVIAEGDAGTSNAVFIVSLSAAAAETVTVNFATADGTASAGADYQPASGQLVFAPNDTQKSITVPVIGDNVLEEDETFLLTLSASSGPLIVSERGVGTIRDDEADLTDGLTHHWKFDETAGDIAADSVGGNHARLFNWGVNEDRWVPGRIGGALDFSEADNFTRTMTGIPQTLYTITFWMNRRQDVGINPRVVEAPDGASSITINRERGDGIGFVGRVVDEEPPVLLNWEHYAVTIDHSLGEARVYRNAAEVASGSFTPDIPRLPWVFGHHYDQSNQNDPLSGWLDDLRVYDRILSETDIRALGTEASFVSINDVAVVEGDNGTTNAVFTVSLSPTLPQSVTVDYTTVDGTATGGVDYVATAGQLTFTSGQSQQSLVVPVVGDLNLEEDERFFVQLSNAVNATIIAGRGVGTIQDDEVDLNRGLRHHWKFDDIEGDRATDSVGDNDIRLFNWGPTEPKWVPGRLGGALDFGDADNIGLTSKGIEHTQYSVSFWMNVSRQSGVNPRIVAPEDGYHINIHTEFSGGGVGFFDVGDPAQPQLLNWEHYAVTIDHISTEVKIYRDGSIVAAGNVNAPIPQLPWFIGHTNNFRFHNDSIDALLDDLRVYDRILSDVDVRALGSEMAYLSVDDAVIFEGDDGTRSAVFSVSLSPAVADTVTVAYSTTDVSAVAGVDYVASSGQLTFAPNETQKQIAVSVVGDVEREGDETFLLQLSDAVGAALTVDRGRGTVLGDDGDITTGLVHHWKFDEATGDVAYDSVGGNNAALSNWGPTESKWVAGRLGGALNFSDGDNLGLTESGISFPQYTISFWMNVRRPTGINARIVSHPDGPDVVINNESGEGVGRYFKSSDIYDRRAPRLLVWEHYAISFDHTTGVGVLYRNGEEIVTGTFAPEVPELPWVIGHFQDLNNHENSLEGLLDDLRVYDRLLAPVDVREIGRDVPYLSINDVRVTETDAGGAAAVFTVALSPAVSDFVTVSFATSDGSATAGTDYESSSGQLTFLPNETEKTITVQVVGDLVFDGDETFFVDLTDAAGANLAVSRGLGTIVDNEQPPSVTLTLDPTQIPEAAGVATVTATLSEVSSGEVTIDLAFSGTAESGVDYSSSGSSILIPAGSLSGSVTLTASQDTIDEPDETVIVEVVAVDGAVHAGARQQILTIIDDDSAVPQVTLSVDNVAIPEAGGVATLLVSLTSTAAQTVIVNLGFAGTATSGTDYTVSSTQVVIPTGSLVGASAVVAIQDTIDELDEAIIVEITSVSNAIESGVQSQTVTIIDDDEAAGLLVTSLDPTSTGFVVHFNRDLDAARLNLYDAETAGFGPADIVLQGAATGAVNGSLVVDPTHRQATFLQTSGPLVADTYTVTLRSAPDGFTDSAGDLLDGDGDGAPGGNFVDTFVVTAPPTNQRTVGIPHFVRGPGQDVNVPADVATGIPIVLSEGDGVGAVDLRIAFDPSLLNVEGVTVGDAMPSGATVAVNNTTSGLLILSFFSPTVLPAGTHQIANLQAKVPTAGASGNYLRQQLIDVHQVTVTDGDDNELPAADVDAVHVAAFYGDTTGNGKINASDASRVARVGVLLDQGFRATPLVDPIVVGDVSGNGRINAADAAKVARAGVLLPVPEIPPIPDGVLVAAGRLAVSFSTAQPSRQPASLPAPAVVGFTPPSMQGSYADREFGGASSRASWQLPASADAVNWAEHLDQVFGDADLLHRLVEELTATELLEESL